MKILMIGLGSIGSKHAGIIQRLYPDYKIFALRTDYPPKFSMYKIENLHSWREVEIIRPDVAIICNPTYKHIDTAIKCAKLGMHIFLEKPIDCTLTRLDKLVQIVENKNLVCFIAYPFRFHDDIIKLKARLNRKHTFLSNIVCRSYMPNWRNYKTYSNNFNHGGGAVLELSHEIDLAAFLFGPVVDLSGWSESIGEVVENGESYADLHTVHASGDTCSILLDILSRDKEERYINIRNLDTSEEFELNYGVSDKVYTNQIEYFFENLNDPLLENNIFDASELFRKIIYYRNKGE